MFSLPEECKLIIIIFLCHNFQTFVWVWIKFDLIEVSLICFDQLNVTIFYVDVKLNFTENC